MDEELTNVQKAWRSVPWQRVEDHLTTLGVHHALARWNQGEELGMMELGTIQSLIDLLVEFMLLHIRTGEFTPHSINPDYRDNPRAMLRGWFEEGAEEFLINAILDEG